MVHIYTDGSGKTGKYAYLIEEKNKLMIFEKKGITNNEAEYMALIKALEDNSSEKEITILSDSKLMVSQLKHEYAIKEDRLRDLAQKVWALCADRKVEFQWVPREKNKVGKILG